MTILRVNLPVSYIEASSEYVELFIRRGIRPEIGLDAGVIDRLPADYHEGVANTFIEAGLTPSIHLPFQDLLPGARDPLVREATVKRLNMAFEIAKIYGPVHMIGHAVYWEPFYLNTFDEWLDNSAATWREFVSLRPDHPPLYLENVFETDPGPLALLMEALDDPNVGICLDLGHWHSFGGGAGKRDLDRWVETLAPWIRHLHLHDNDGSSDLHLGLGKGTIPWSELFSLLAGRGLGPSFTLEPHEERSFEDSLSFIAAHPDWFKLLSQD